MQKLMAKSQWAKTLHKITYDKNINDKNVRKYFYAQLAYKNKSYCGKTVAEICHLKISQQYTYLKIRLPKFGWKIFSLPDKSKV